MVKNVKGGDFIYNLINIFSYLLLLYIFITLYSIYTFFDIILFHNLSKVPN